MSSFTSGFIAIVGLPNVGKSTLMNALVGQKIAIVSSKAQTTRNRIMGVVTGKGYQLVLMDTPGMTNPKNRLGEFMQKAAVDSTGDADCVLWLIDGKHGVGERDAEVAKLLAGRKAPIVVAINKSDECTFDDIETAREAIEAFGVAREIIKISALNGSGLDKLINALKGYMPEGPMYFPEDMVTDQPERLIISEMIREKALNLLRQEIPHGIGVDIDKIEARDDGITDVTATLYCERDSHKGIIIGRGGAMLKAIGTAARHDIQWLLGTQVNLQLWVKVKEDWRNSSVMLKELGYTEE